MIGARHTRSAGRSGGGNDVDRDDRSNSITQECSGSVARLNILRSHVCGTSSALRSCQRTLTPTGAVLYGNSCIDIGCRPVRAMARGRGTIAVRCASCSNMGSARKFGSETAKRGLWRDPEKARSRAPRSNISDRRANPRSNTNPSTIPSRSLCSEMKAIGNPDNCSSERLPSFRDEFAMRTSSYSKSALDLKRAGVSENVPIAASIWPRLICSVRSSRLSERIAISTKGASALSNSRR